MVVVVVAMIGGNDTAEDGNMQAAESLSHCTSHRLHRIIVLATECATAVTSVSVVSNRLL